MDSLEKLKKDPFFNTKIDDVKKHLDEWSQNEKNAEDFLTYYIKWLEFSEDGLDSWYGVCLDSAARDELMILDRLYQIYKDAGGLD